jgi:hypothetical protein
MTKTFDLSTIIEAALLQGATRRVVEEEVQRSATAAGAEMPDSAAIDAIYASIVENWITDAECDPDESFAYAVRLRKHLYQRSYHLNDFKTCLAIAESLAKLIAKHDEQARKVKEAKSFAKQFDITKTAPLKSIKGGKK